MFGGGFLMPNDGEAGDDKPVQRGQMSADKQRKKSSIIPLTLRTVLNISATAQENVEVDGRPVTQVVVVGRVITTEEHPTRTIFLLDDTTGQLEIIYYKKNDDVAPPMLTKLSNRRNMYLKAVVSIRPFKDKKIYVSTNLEEVTDYNQVTYFFLNCFAARAYRVKGPLPEDANLQGVGSKSKSFDDNQSNRGPTTNTTMDQSSMGVTTSSNISDPNLRLIKNAIKKITAESNGANASIDQILSKFPNKFTAKQIKLYTDELINAGEIYTMEDDNHFNAI